MNQHRQAGHQGRSQNHDDEADVAVAFVTQRCERGRIQDCRHRAGSGPRCRRETVHQLVPEMANGPPVAGH